MFSCVLRAPSKWFAISTQTGRQPPPHTCGRVCLPIHWPPAYRHPPPPRAPPPRPPFAHAATAGGILSYRDRVVGGGDNAIAQLAERQTVVVSSRYLLVTGSIPVGESFSFSDLPFIHCIGIE